PGWPRRVRTWDRLLHIRADGNRRRFDRSGRPEPGPTVGAAHQVSRFRDSGTIVSTVRDGLTHGATGTKAWQRTCGISGGMTMDIESSGETFTITEDASAKRFTLSHAGTVIGHVDYIDREAGADDTAECTIRTFTHTEVSPEWGGRGLAAQLVRYALETSAEAGLKFRTTCSYVHGFLQKNTEIDQYLACGHRPRRPGGRACPPARSEQGSLAPPAQGMLSPPGVAPPAPDDEFRTARLLDRHYTEQNRALATPAKTSS